MIVHFVTNILHRVFLACVDLNKKWCPKIFLGIVLWHHQLYPLAENLIFPNNINIGIVGKIIEFGTNFKSDYSPKVPSSWDIAF